MAKLEKRIRKAFDADFADGPASGNMKFWTLTLREGITLDDVLVPVFWSNVARRVDKQFHHYIIVVNDSHDIDAELYVRAVQENQMVVAVRRPLTHFGPQEIAQSGDLTIRWNVGKRGYDVVRVGDGQIIQDGSQFGVKEQALGWIAQHRKAMAA